MNRAVSNLHIQGAPDSSVQILTLRQYKGVMHRLHL
jgi:hypothetical protein